MGTCEVMFSFIIPLEFVSKVSIWELSGKAKSKGVRLKLEALYSW